MNRAGDALASARPRRLGADVGSASDFASNASLFALFLRGFHVVMTLAEALQVTLVSEHIPVAAVRDNVVNDRRRCAVPRIAWRIQPSALTAERLAQELRRAEPVCPDRQHVPPVISCACLALLPRLVLVAPALARQHTASRMITRPQRFTRHGLSPPSLSKQKSRGQQQTRSCVYHWPRLLKHWPRLMSIRCSVLQKRQKTTRLVAVVSGSILSSFLLPRQVGHWRNPSFTVSLSEKP